MISIMLNLFSLNTKNSKIASISRKRHALSLRIGCCANAILSAANAMTMILYLLQCQNWKKMDNFAQRISGLSIRCDRKIKHPLRRKLLPKNRKKEKTLAFFSAAHMEVDIARQRLR